MRVSIAIVNWNTRDLLRQCLTSLKSDLGQDTFEAIVVDNRSADGSADMVAADFPYVKLIRNDTNAGFTKAMNQAFAASTGDYFLMFNSDAFVKDDAIARCVRYIDERPGVAVLGCRIEYPDGSTQSSCFRFKSLGGIVLTSLYFSQIFKRSNFLNWDRYGYAEFDRPTEVNCVMGGFMMIRRSAIEGDELLDSHYFMYGEEEDLCFRLRQRGHKTIFYPHATVVHHHSGSSSKPHVAAWVYEMKRRAALRFLWKWRGSGAAWLANLILTADLLPRGVAWAVGDLVAAARGRGKFPDRLLRLRVLRFHLRALVRTSLFASEWGPDK